jgi:hypothetical protein
LGIKRNIRLVDNIGGVGLGNLLLHVRKAMLARKQTC